MPTRPPARSKRPSESGTDASRPGHSSPACGWGTRPRRTRGTPRSRLVLRSSASIVGRCSSFISPVAGHAVGQFLNLVFLHQLFAQFQLIIRRLIKHAEHLVLRPHVLFRVPMAFNTPLHV